jgi:hypothetical protein
MPSAELWSASSTDHPCSVIRDLSKTPSDQQLHQNTNPVDGRDQDHIGRSTKTLLEGITEQLDLSLPAV